MTVTRPTRALAIDHAGTITTSARARPTGALVKQVLADFGVAVPASFTACFDRSRNAWYEESLPDSLARLLAAVAAHEHVELPPVGPLLDRIWTLCGDHPIDPGAAGRVRALHAEGLSVVLATNTCRPKRFRAATLEAAGLGFMSLVCSSEIGVAKPEAGFYAAVIQAAGVPAEEILFVGDNVHRDVSAPRRSGMKAAWIDRNRDASRPPERMADGTLILSALAQLTPELIAT